MKLPFLLNTASRACSTSDVEGLLSKLERVISRLDGPQVSNILNLLSKKDVEHSKTSWTRISRALLARPVQRKAPENNCREWSAHGHDTDQLHHQFAPADDTVVTLNLNKVSCSYNYAENKESHRSDDKNRLSSALCTYDIKDVIIILNAFSKVGVVPPELMVAVVEIVVKQLNAIGSHEISTLIHTLGKHGMIDDLKAVLDGCKTVDDRSLNEHDYSMILTALILNESKLKKSFAFDKLVGVIDSKCESMSDKSIAILVNSLAKFGKDERGILLLLVPLIIKRFRDGSFDPMSVSQIANGVARLDLLNPELMTAIAQRIRCDKNNFSTRCKVTILNAFHKLNFFDSKLFEDLVADLTSCNADMTPQCVANTVAAVAHFSDKMRHKDLLPLLKALYHRVCMMKSLRRFTMQNQANILNGFSKIGLHDKEIYMLLGDNMLGMKGQLKSIDVAIILNAFARAKVMHNIVAYLCENLQDYLAGMKAQELTCCIASLNRLRKCDIEAGDCDDSCTWMSAINAIKSFLVLYPNVIHTFRPLDVRLTMTVFSDCGIVDHGLYTMLLERLEEDLRRASMWDVVCVLSSLVNTGYVVNTRFLDAVEASLPFIGKCKNRARGDANAMRNTIERMQVKHSLLDKLAQYT
ncbi:uncharacterized protein BXIN_0695 [Babesia sp. Xinjiang]|uniref:uncharacterized protein n=1 Tax=Babesia sp. Xinjiang TaxID=462227 RepID=UPI000A233D90|nr:uncharacterized protein BXIN_0704 [Babesia sp. Xinjiang]XP_028872611.1 uncharacterized protein BXIN_0695 [Babesia sp. Xinjiang]ORM42122.1 hypothetical protein BXIN_0704 [Babesia sp. Xinjiang]ORM42155.1 hypothetical protein BXIN_0695 [Babesia sp. Xinjiang]